MGQVKALIIVGYGLNCEAETAHALAMAGAVPEQVHLSDLIAGKRALADFDLLALIGGFSFGDHISAGKVFANRLKCRLRDPLQAFIDGGKLIIGICNGFQTLVKLGLLPGFDGDYATQQITLSQNDSGVFRNAWIRLRGEPGSRCVFSRGVESLEVPVRHGEGKLVVREASVMKRLNAQGQVVFRYTHPDTGVATMDFPHNPNGSMEAVAGICDPTGRIFGLMPHPEAFTSPFNHPHWIKRKLEGRLPEQGAGLKIFQNAVRYLEGRG